MVGSRSWCMVWSGGWWVVWLGLWVAWNPLISYLSDVTIVMISCVLDMLGPTVRESHRVGATHSLTIRHLTSIECSLGVIICHSILIRVRLGRVLRLFVSRGRVIGSRFGVVRCWRRGSRLICWFVNHHWGRFVGWGWCRFMVNWCGFVIDWGRFMVGWRRSMVRGWGRSMVRSWCRSVVRSRGRGMIRCWGWMVGGW